MDAIIGKKLRYKKGLAIFTYAGSVMFLVMGVGSFYIAYGEVDYKQKLLMLVLGFVHLFFAVYCSAGIYRTYILINGNSIVYSSIFRKKSLYLNSIKGYRLNSKYLTIVPLHKNDGNITINNISSYTHFQHIRYWFHNNIPNLDTIEYKQEIEQLKYDNRAGVNDYDRLKRLGIARKIVRGLAIVCLVLIVLTIYVFPQSDVLITILLLFPIMSVVIMQYYKGIIRFDGYQRGAYPIMGVVIIMSSLGIFLKAILDVAIYNFTNLWYIGGLSAAICYVLLDRLTLNEPKLNSKRAHIALMLLVALPFAFGGVTLVNSYYDTTKPVVYKAKVLKKRFAFDRVITYNITLSAWGNHDDGEEEIIPYHLYSELSEGDSVKVLVKKGTLDISWYTVTSN